jgi:hypothetical protein
MSDESVKTVERINMTIFDAVSNCGGIMGFVFAFMNILMSSISEIKF